ncbi:hypothetical protein DT075_09995 [Bacillus licheniformis]|nr:hypothetical protein DT075_09995 [Bacillus licheniformis]
MNKIGLTYGKSPLTKNYRMISEFKHQYGSALLVKVGAMYINSIVMLQESKEWRRGDEIAYFSLGTITRDKQFTVKQKLYSVEEMIGRSEIVNRYVGGTYIIIYLSPRDYHRIHSPAYGTLETQYSLGSSQSKLSKPLIPSYIKTFHINTEEMLEDVRSFNSLHELFIRKLKSGARPLPADPNSLVSPVDGVIEELLIYAGSGAFIWCLVFITIGYTIGVI